MTLVGGGTDPGNPDTDRDDLNDYDEYEPADEFSIIVMSDVGDDYLYRNSDVDRKGIVTYAFELDTNVINSIGKLTLAINRHYDLISGKTTVWIADSPTGATWSRIIFRNFSNSENLEYDHDGFCYMEVRYDQVSPFDLIETYRQIENIKSAEIPDWLQEKAEAEGINWYDVWPQLEELKVYKLDERGFKVYL